MYEIGVEVVQPELRAGRSARGQRSVVAHVVRLDLGDNEQLCTRYAAARNGGGEDDGPPPDLPFSCAGCSACGYCSQECKDA
eukprot:COSAG06_NODE_41331_length_392_cov_1.058020_1_plen_81_part_10